MDTGLSVLSPDNLSLFNSLLLVLASFLTSAISATFGLGGGVAMLIALLSLVPPAVAVPVHAIVQVGSNAGRAWLLRSHIMQSIVRWFIPGAIVGVIFASQFVTAVPVHWLQLVLAVFILWSIWAPKIRSHAIADRSYFGVGAVSSFCTMFLGATGPMLAAFLSPDRYGRDATVATHAASMGLQHLLKIIAFGVLGFAFTEWLPLLLLMLLSGWLGTVAGGRLLRKLPEARFKLLFKLVLSGLALRLLFSAMTQW